MDFKTTCRHCGATIDPKLGADAPGTHADAEGTQDDPRAPGDWDNVCEICGYRDDKPGSPLTADDVRWSA
jgi:hypothetical protein